MNTEMETELSTTFYMVDAILINNYSLCQQWEGLGGKRVMRDAGENSKSMFKVSRYYLMNLQPPRPASYHNLIQCSHILYAK